MHQRAWLLVLLLVIGTSGEGFSESPDDLTKEGKDAYEVIAKSEKFCDTAVGYAGTMPEVVHAFRVVLGEAGADKAFKKLLSDATISGKLYALCGLYYTDPDYFQKAVEPFRHSDAKVKTFMGCIVSQWRVSEIVEQSLPNVVRLKNRKQTIKEWAEETKPESMIFDIVGGGWPNRFKEDGGYR
jgi:hypothetical protein